MCVCVWLNKNSRQFLPYLEGDAQSQLFSFWLGKCLLSRSVNFSASVVVVMLYQLAVPSWLLITKPEQCAMHTVRGWWQLEMNKFSVGLGWCLLSERSDLCDLSSVRYRSDFNYILVECDVSELTLNLNLCCIKNLRKIYHYLPTFIFINSDYANSCINSLMPKGYFCTCI